MTRNQCRMVGIVRAIRAGKWTHEPPTWAKHSLTEYPGFESRQAESVWRAIQTAEAFIILELTGDSPLDVLAFVKACGF